MPLRTHTLRSCRLSKKSDDKPEPWTIEDYNELQQRVAELEKERDDYKKVAMDHKEISTCVNEYRYMKANKHLFNKEQQSATYEQIVDRLLKCVKE